MISVERAPLVRREAIARLPPRRMYRLTVRVPYPNGGWEVSQGGGPHVERVRAPVSRWTCATNWQKPSGIAATETILNTHPIPLLGAKKLDAITTEQVQQLKRHLTHRAPKTVNYVLTVLNVLLKKAVEWDVVEQMPCVIRLLPIPKPSAGFYDFAEYEQLVTAARADRTAYLIVLLGGDARLRCGEMMTLEWTDVDLSRRQRCVQWSDWKGHVTTTKGGRLRYVPLTVRLAGALRAHRRLRGPRVLCQSDGTLLTQKIVQDHVRGPNGGRGLRRSACIGWTAPKSILPCIAANYHGTSKEPIRRRSRSTGPWITSSPKASAARFWVVATR
jgi:integrase